MKIHPYVIVFLSAIVVANLLASYFGPTITIYTAFFFIGLDLFVRDTLHDLWKEKLPQKMFLLVLAGSLITVALNINAGPIALASTVAFAVAFIGDGKFDLTPLKEKVKKLGIKEPGKHPQDKNILKQGSKHCNAL